MSKGQERIAALEALYGEARRIHGEDNPKVREALRHLENAHRIHQKEGLIPLFSEAANAAEKILSELVKPKAMQEAERKSFSNPEQIACRNCRTVMEESWERCPLCGEEQQGFVSREPQMPVMDAECHSCGQKVVPDWRMCPYCDADLSAERGVAPERGPQVSKAGPTDEQRSLYEINRAKERMQILDNGWFSASDVKKVENILALASSLHSAQRHEKAINYAKKAQAMTNEMIERVRAMPPEDLIQKIPPFVRLVRALGSDHASVRSLFGHLVSAQKLLGKEPEAFENHLQKVENIAKGLEQELKEKGAKLVCSGCGLSEEDIFCPRCVYCGSEEMSIEIQAAPRTVHPPLTRMPPPPLKTTEFGARAPPPRTMHEVAALDPLDELMRQLREEVAPRQAAAATGTQKHPVEQLIKDRESSGYPFGGLLPGKDGTSRYIKFRFDRCIGFVKHPDPSQGFLAVIHAGASGEPRLIPTNIDQVELRKVHDPKIFDGIFVKSSPITDVALKQHLIRNLRV